MSDVTSNFVGQGLPHVQSTHSSLLFFHMHANPLLYFMSEDAVAQRGSLIALTRIPCLIGMRLAPEHVFSDSIFIWKKSVRWKIGPCALNILSRESKTALDMWISNSILFNKHKHNWILICLSASPYKNHQNFFVCVLTYVFQKFPTVKELGKCQFLVNYLLLWNLKSPNLEGMKLASVVPPPAPLCC